MLIPRFTVYALLPSALAALVPRMPVRWTMANGTMTNQTTTNGTESNGTWPYNASTPSPPHPPRPQGPACLDTFYPSELRIVNSRYASFNSTNLHDRDNMFMALRQREDTFQVATQVQFNGISASNTTSCHLKFEIPGDGLQQSFGPLPILYVYQVSREATSLANWELYDPANVTANHTLYGQINGTNEEQAFMRQYYGSYYDVGSGSCNQTMTFQIGFPFDGGEEVNYWQFINTAPPLTPVHGFKLWMGEEWCVGK